MKNGILFICFLLLTVTASAQSVIVGSKKFTESYVLGEIAKRTLEETGTVVLPGSAFGPAGEGFFRIALTVGPERLREAAQRLGRTLAATSRGALAPAT